MVSQKCQYAVRAMFELAKQHGNGPIKIGAIADAQAIPVRFLEVILNQLRQGGFVKSRRGADGGYYLIRQPGEIKVGEIIQFVEGSQVPVACMMDKDGQKCSLRGSCVFIGMWERVAKAASDVYDRTSLQDLINEEIVLQHSTSTSYSI